MTIMSNYKDFLIMTISIKLTTVIKAKKVHYRLKATQTNCLFCDAMVNRLIYQRANRAIHAVYFVAGLQSCKSDKSNHCEYFVIFR